VQKVCYYNLGGKVSDIEEKH